MDQSRLLHLAGVLTEAKASSPSTTEKKHYIVSNGSRVAGPFNSEKEADDELLKRQRRAKPEDEFDDAKVVFESLVEGKKTTSASDAQPSKAELIQQLCSDTGLEGTLDGKAWKKVCGAIKKAFDAGVKNCSAK